MKVEVDALPPSLVEQIKMGKVNLNDPAVTLALLKLNAVVGVTGHFAASGNLSSVGIQCALCHSTVDNSNPSFCFGQVTPNPGTGCIGHRLDGWPNRDLNVGAIVALAPDLSLLARLLSTEHMTVRKVLKSWDQGSLMLSCSWMEKHSTRSRRRTEWPPELTFPAHLSFRLHSAISENGVFGRCVFRADFGQRVCPTRGPIRATASQQPTHHIYLPSELDCVDQTLLDLDFNGKLAQSDPNEIQTPICRPVTEPTQDPTGGNIKHTAHLYVFVPMFSVDNDTNPNDAMPCPNGGRPGELCGPALGAALIKFFGFVPEALEGTPAGGDSVPGS